MNETVKKKKKKKRGRRKEKGLRVAFILWYDPTEMGDKIWLRPVPASQAPCGMQNQTEEIQPIRYSPLEEPHQSNKGEEKVEYQPFPN